MHVCEKIFCKICFIHDKPGHKCYIKKHKTKAENKSFTIIFFDIECMQNINEDGEKEHVPNLLVCSKICEKCFERSRTSAPYFCTSCQDEILQHFWTETSMSCVEKFINYLMSMNFPTTHTHGLYPYCMKTFAYPIGHHKCINCLPDVTLRRPYLSRRQSYARLFYSSHNLFEKTIFIGIHGRSCHSVWIESFPTDTLSATSYEQAVLDSGSQCWAFISLLPGMFRKYIPSNERQFLKALYT